MIPEAKSFVQFPENFSFLPIFSSFDVPVVFQKFRLPISNILRVHTRAEGLSLEMNTHSTSLIAFRENFHWNSGVLEF